MNINNNKNEKPVPLVEMGPIFVLLDVLTRLTLKNQYIEEGGIVIPKSGESFADVDPIALLKVRNWMGEHGELFDTQGYARLGEETVDSWCKFLLINLDQFNDFLSRYSVAEKIFLRGAFFEVINDQEVQDELRQLSNKIKSSRNQSKQHLLNLFALSEMVREQMFNNTYSAQAFNGLEKMELRQDFFSALGPVGLFWNGEPNKLISSDEIEKLMSECDVSQEEFTKFYILNAQERCVMYNYCQLF